MQAYEPAERSSPQFEEWLERQQYREPLLRPQGRAAGSATAMPQFGEESRPPTRDLTPQAAPATERRQQAGPDTGRQSASYPSDFASSRSDMPREPATAEQTLPMASNNPQARAPRYEEQRENLNSALDKEKFGNQHASLEESAAEEPLGASDRDALWHEPDTVSPKISNSSENDAPVNKLL